MSRANTSPCAEISAGPPTNPLDQVSLTQRLEALQKQQQQLASIQQQLQFNPTGTTVPAPLSSVPPVNMPTPSPQPLHHHTNLFVPPHTPISQKLPAAPVPSTSVSSSSMVDGAATADASEQKTEQTTQLAPVSSASSSQSMSAALLPPAAPSPEPGSDNNGVSKHASPDGSEAEQREVVETEETETKQQNNPSVKAEEQGRNALAEERRRRQRIEAELETAKAQQNQLAAQLAQYHEQQRHHEMLMQQQLQQFQLMQYYQILAAQGGMPQGFDPSMFGFPMMMPAMPGQGPAGASPTLRPAAAGEAAYVQNGTAAGIPASVPAPSTATAQHEASMHYRPDQPKKVACTACRKSKVRCEGGIPCRRCINSNRTDQCVQCAPRKRAGAPHQRRVPLHKSMAADAQASDSASAVGRKRTLDAEDNEAEAAELLALSMSPKKRKADGNGCADEYETEDDLSR